VPESPMIFMKPSHAVVPMNGNVIQLPGKFGIIHFEAEVVIRRGLDGIDSFALGIDLTFRDLQNKLKEKQHPWLKAKGFQGSAPLTAFHKLSHINELYLEEFSLKVNGVEKQRGQCKDMIFNFSTLMDCIGKHYGLKNNDIIFTGTPAGVDQLIQNDYLELFWGNQQFGHCKIEII